MPQLLVTTPVTLTLLSSYLPGWSFSWAILTPRAAQPVINKTPRSATDSRDALFMTLSPVTRRDRRALTQAMCRTGSRDFLEEIIEATKLPSLRGDRVSFRNAVSFRKRCVLSKCSGTD